MDIIKKIINAINKYKVSILIGIITTIFCTYIVSPLINFLPYMSKNIFVSIQDSIYFSAGKVTDNTAILSLLALLLGVISGTLSYYYKFFNSKPVDIDYSVQDENSLENLKDKLEKKIKKLTRILKTLIISSIIILFVFFSFYIIRPIELKDKFDISLIEIAPYIDKNEVDKLNSDWVQMIGKADYNNIKIRIEKIIEEYDLVK